MKLLIITILSSFSILAYAEIGGDETNQPTLDPFSAKMEEIHACVQKIDEKQLGYLADKAKNAQEKIRSLCAKNNTDGAMEIAEDFADTLKRSAALKQLELCTEDLPAMLKNRMKLLDFDELKKQTDKTICDAKFNQ